MPTVVWKFEGDAADLEQALATVRGEAQGAESALSSTGKAGSDGLKKVAAVAGGVLLAGIAASTVAAVKLSRAVVSVAGDLDNLAKQAGRAGTTAQELDTVRGVFDLWGVSINQTDTLVKKLRVNLGKAAIGTAAQADALELLGVTAADFNGLKLDEKLGLVAKGMEGIEDPAVRATVATDLLGRTGLDILPLLEQGGEAFRSYAEKIEEVGVVSNQWAKDSEDLVDQIALTNRVLTSMKQHALAPLIPAFAGVIEAVRETALEFRDTEAMEDFGTTAADVLLGVIAPSAVILAGEMRKAMGGITASIQAAVVTLGLLEAGFLMVTLRTKKAWAATDRNRESIDRFNEAIRDLGGTQQDTEEAVQSLLGRLDRLRGRLAGARDAAASPDGLAGGLEEVEEAAGAAGEAVQSLTSWLEEAAEGAGIDLGVLDFLHDPDVQMDLGDLFAEEVLTGLERAEAGFQAFKEVWSQGLGEIVNAAGRLAIEVFDLFADMERDVMDERIAAHQETGDRIAHINKKLTTTVNDQERERLEGAKAYLTERAAAEKEAALEAFERQKALALISAAINTALAVINALATAPTIVAGIVLAALAGAAGGVAIATIASQKPPSFHAGGVLRASDVAGSSMDSISVRAKPGEGFLSTSGVAAAGGPDGVDALNAGRGGGGGTSINVFRFGTRTTEAISHQQLRSRTGNMQSALRGVRPKVGRSIPGRR